LDPDKIGNTEEKVIQKIIDKTLEILKNDKILKQMSKNCMEQVKSGKFSIKERNKKLRKIYEEALN
jgi:glycosyltransferase involved in cell wall biosynthesis